MAYNYATDYNQPVLERLSLKSVTNALMGADYSWDGSKSVVVSSVDTAAMNDYTRTGTARYGTPTELGNTQQTLTLSKDRSFAMTIDKRNAAEFGIEHTAQKALARQLDEVAIPEIDVYRIANLAAGAPVAHVPTAAALTASNAYTKFLALQEFLDEDKVPQVGRAAFVTPAALNFLKLDANFVKASDIAQDMLIKGQVGEVDGVPLVKVPTSYMPTNHAIVLFHTSAIAAPVVLEDFTIHENPPGISGHLIEGRLVYDAFVLTQRVNAIACHKIA